MPMTTNQATLDKLNELKLSVLETFGNPIITNSWLTDDKQANIAFAEAYKVIAEAVRKMNSMFNSQVWEAWATGQLPKTVAATRKPRPEDSLPTGRKPRTPEEILFGVKS